MSANQATLISNQHIPSDLPQDIIENLTAFQYEVTGHAKPANLGLTLKRLGEDKNKTYLYSSRFVPEDRWTADQVAVGSFITAWICPRDFLYGYRIEKKPNSRFFMVRPNQDKDNLTDIRIAALTAASRVGLDEESVLRMAERFEAWITR